MWGRGAPILQHTFLMLEHQITNSQSIRAWDLYIMLYIILHLSPKSSKVLNVPPSFILTTSSHLQWNINTVQLGRKRQYQENEAKSQDESLAEIDLQFNFPYWASRFFQTYKGHVESKQLGVSSVFYPEVCVCMCVYIHIPAQIDTQSCIHAYTHPYSYTHTHTHTLTHIIILQPKSQLTPGWLNLGIFLSQT